MKIQKENHTHTKKKSRGKETHYNKTRQLQEVTPIIKNKKREVTRINRIG